MVSKVVISFWLMSLLFSGFSQKQEEMSYAEQLAALEDELDSLSIFNLLDSVLSLDNIQKSELNIRYGFTSSVTSSGRDYNINQTGFSGGLAWFHKSGIYTDLSGYWNSDVTPGYNPTILSAGYLGSFSKKWNYSLDYEHWFYNPGDSSENPLTNSLGTSLSYDFKVGYASVDYSYLFGKESSGRVIGSLSGNINMGKFWMFKSVRIFPTFNLMAGDGNVTTLRITNQQISEGNQLRINRIDSLSMLSDDQRRYLAFLVNRAYENGNISLRRRNSIINDLLLASTLTDEELNELVGIAENGTEAEEFTNSNAFGILNYSFTLPLSLSTNRISILISYTYSIPVKLPGEFFDVDPIGYFGVSFLYRIPFN